VWIVSNGKLWLIFSSQFPELTGCRASCRREFGDGWKKEPPTTTKADSVAAAARRTSPARFDHL
jgi:hypothetical protein